jgi:hypothetical protein
LRGCLTAPDTYQAGLLAFVGDLAVVRAHNVWTRRWPFLLTLVGWFGVGSFLTFKAYTPERGGE